MVADWFSLAETRLSALAACNIVALHLQLAKGTEPKTGFFGATAGILGGIHCGTLSSDDWRDSCGILWGCYSVGFGVEFF